MNKKKWVSLIAGYSIIYTIITLLSSVLYLCNGIYEDPSGNWHELDRAIILLIGVTAFILCTRWSLRPFILRYVIAYIPSQILVFLYVWLSSFREELASSAYRDIWINFTSMFVVLCTINTVVNTCMAKKKGKR